MIQPIPAGTSVVVTAPVGVSGETLLTVNSGQGLTLAGDLTTGTTIDVFKGAAIIGTTPLATDNIFVARAYNLSAGGHWDGTDSITSTAAEFDTTRLTAVGVIGNNQSRSPLYSATRPFHDVTPGTNATLVAYTYFGDANLDGIVDGSDYSLIDAGYASGGGLTGWYHGDFNYDGVIDGSDYALIDNAFNNQTADLSTGALVAGATDQAAGGAAVPEPAVSLLLAPLLLPRRRRRRGARS